MKNQNILVKTFQKSDRKIVEAVAKLVNPNTHRCHIDQK